jgi:hypothetical protein
MLASLNNTMKRLFLGLLLSFACFADSPLPFFNGALVATVVNVKTAPGGLYGFAIGNTAVTVCFLQIFNATAANVTLGTTVPTLSIPVSLSSATVSGGISLSFSNSPVAFNTAMSIAGTTQANNSTPCATGLVVNIFYL